MRATEGPLRELFQTGILNGIRNARVRDEGELLKLLFGIPSVVRAIAPLGFSHRTGPGLNLGQSPTGDVVAKRRSGRGLWDTTGKQDRGDGQAHRRIGRISPTTESTAIRRALPRRQSGIPSISPSERLGRAARAPTTRSLGPNPGDCPGGRRGRGRHHGYSRRC